MNKTKAELMAMADNAVETCNLCSLNSGYYLPVPGVGSSEPDLFILLEAPAEQESNPLQHPGQRFGVPAIGPAGQELQAAMADIGFGRHKLYVTNTVLHKTPKNRPPTAEEKATCSAHLRMRLMITRPKVILALGKHASEVLRVIGGAPPLGEQESHRGKDFDFYLSYGLTPLTARVFSTYHPSYACLRNPQMKPGFIEDLQRVYSYMGGT